ncbi:increased DNA methylation 2 [Ricinus communis]|uniref:SHSP domain-containing protein n=1 Tax=Ricinus communis TaxID=3988 RepID=B9RF37_RICCO|nr:increased DNA methylation 2 [Ricinus communis]XP_015570484.1 increased DNA methylation 2 [Ricinus communis]XP_015570485.1 increased DNA methylation 2 [Ricinus communis]XP_015570487.1 increased DNA methylation 2 [Ricinus communis]XP_015570488.1 increased DNA methylation 2 [Ricinus communis]XP_025011930.1 increased DNA methylation 2 [Ricinus communis]XP_048225537.1 increased DNA methylation 2 [Ricinus communis]EEF49808.1 conserved hypothetical protein [Ricinus communis]|eukprot:XP_002512356.1 increased DNA methylation 2 [Ricinus communis]
MESLVQATNSLMRSESFTASSRIPNSDQRFLLYFVMGTYFGPDLKEECPQKSILQRKAEGLPTYTSDHLAGSHMKTVEMERVYYYALRKAEKSLAVKLPLLHHFFQGTIPTSWNDPCVVYPQFPELFPPQLHPHSRFKNKYKIIENIIFINDPNTSYNKPDDIERFKKLTGLENLLLDRDVARFHTFGVQDAEPVGEFPPAKPSHSSRNRNAKRPASTLQTEDQYIHVAPFSSVRYNAPPPVQRYTTLPIRNNTRTVENGSPGMLFLPSCPKKEELTRIIAAGRSGFALTGSAAMGQVGPIIGLMDIGECEDSYMFRISLPGVKRDEEDFSCVVENDGMVLIKGVTTTGERTVYRFSQVFEMQSKNLCPPGEFSISFQLPGPVNPRQFSGNFGTDGILEGIVMKQKGES